MRQLQFGAYASYPKRSSEFKTKSDHFKYYLSEIQSQAGTMRTFSNPPMTFLSAWSLSSTGAGGGALCASASVMLAARLLYFHSGDSPRLALPITFLLLLLWGFAVAAVFLVALLPPCGSRVKLWMRASHKEPRSHFLPSPRPNAPFTLAWTCPVWSLQLLCC